MKDFCNTLELSKVDPNEKLLPVLYRRQLFEKRYYNEGAIIMALNHVGTREMETERIILRKFDLSDSHSAFLNWMGDPKVQNNYDELASNDESEVSHKLKEWINAYDNPDFYRWAIILKGTNETIGQIAFYVVDSKTKGQMLN